MFKNTPFEMQTCIEKILKITNDNIKRVLKQYSDWKIIKVDEDGVGVAHVYVWQSPIQYGKVSL